MYNTIQSPSSYGHQGTIDNSQVFSSLHSPLTITTSSSSIGNNQGLFQTNHQLKSNIQSINISHYYQPTQLNPSSNRHSFRKMEDYEPMSTSPINQARDYLPAFLTGENPLSTSPKTFSKLLSSPSSPQRHHLSSINDFSQSYSTSSDPHQNLYTSGFFDTSNSSGMVNDKILDDREEGSCAEPGPPISGLGRIDENKLYSTIPQRRSVNSGITKQGSTGNNSATGIMFGHLTSTPISYSTAIKSPNISTSIDNSNSIIQPLLTSPDFMSGWSSSIGNNPLTSTWVTVYGFPSSSLSIITSHFSQCGRILDTKSRPGSNWIHLKYSNVLEARKALQMNGTILINGTTMIGVLPYNPPPSDSSTPISNSSMKNQGSKRIISTNGEVDGGPKNGMRAMKVDYDKDHPKQNDGIVSWAMDRIFDFGWKRKE